MQHQAMGYDRSSTMFSPDGKLLQVEYAEKAVRLGAASIGMVCTDGVFILADKRNEDSLVVPESATKVYEIDDHVIGSVAGILSDARILVERSQVVAQQHRVTYDSPVEPESIIKDIANMKQQFTQMGGGRPFGVSFLVAGLQGKKPRLFASDITGNYLEYYSTAIGEQDQKFKQQLREKYTEKLTLKKGVSLALDIFKTVLDKQFKLERLELGYLSFESKRVTRVEGKAIEAFAK